MVVRPCLTGVAIASLLACGSVGRQAASGVEVQPPEAQVLPLDSLLLTATVNGAPGSGVSWEILEAGGGSIDSSGRYVAPRALGTYHVVATSVADRSVSASARISVTGLSISPANATVLAGESMTLAVSPTVPVDWAVEEADGCGAVSPAGVYTPPPASATCHVAATTRRDSSMTARATIDVVTRLNITCVGDSITAGVGASSGHDYSTVLGQLLGEGFVAGNYGHGGATMLQSGDTPYWTQPEFSSSTAFAASGPGDVVIQLGTNDTKPQNWTAAGKASFLADCEALVDHYLTLPSSPRVWINQPPPAFSDGWGIDGTVLREEVLPLLRQCAADKGVGTIDVYSALLPHPEYFPDGIHPNDAGAALIAATARDAVLGLRP